MNPRYPVYVISKGRWESKLTARALERRKVPYRIVIEPQEYKAYSGTIDWRKILVLPFSNLGQGSIPARNWVWEHSIKEGHARHWILDDNIGGFRVLMKNKKVNTTSGTTFRMIEDWTDKFVNVGMAGMQYEFFSPSKRVRPVLTLNTRVYSCILLDNAMPLKWRGRYNEDTDLSLRCLKMGWCTVQFNHLLCKKITTMKMKGGNTDALYKQDGKFDGRLEMARHLQRQHPDCVTIKWKWHRWQHQVDYSRFAGNKFLLRPGMSLPDGPDDYGMVLERDESWRG